MFVVVVNTPLKVIIGLPPVASILVKDASTLQVAPLFRISVAFNVPSLETYKCIDPVLEVKLLKAVVIVYVTEFCKVVVAAEVFEFVNVPTVKPEVPANVIKMPFGIVIVPVADNKEFIVRVPPFP